MSRRSSNAKLKTSLRENNVPHQPHIWVYTCLLSVLYAIPQLWDALALCSGNRIQTAVRRLCTAVTNANMSINRLGRSWPITGHGRLWQVSTQLLGSIQLSTGRLCQELIDQALAPVLAVPLWTAHRMLLWTADELLCIVVCFWINLFPKQLWNPYAGAKIVSHCSGEWLIPTRTKPMWIHMSMHYTIECIERSLWMVWLCRPQVIPDIRKNVNTVTIYSSMNWLRVYPELIPMIL